MDMENDLEGQKGDLGSTNGTLRERIGKSRKRFQNRNQGEYI